MQEVPLSILQSVSHMCRLRVLVGPADSGPQQRDVKKEKEGAMITIMQDGMRVTAANRQAWIEICTCPLSLVCTTYLHACCPAHCILLITMSPIAARHEVRCTMHAYTAVIHNYLPCSVPYCSVLCCALLCCAVLCCAV